MYDVDRLGTIDLGRQGENLARTVQINVSALLAQWPDAVISLLVRRKYDTIPYVAATTVTDGVLCWPITAVETEAAGDGKIELRAVSGDVLAKSATAIIRVAASLTGTEAEVPEAAQGWVDQVLQAVSDFQTAEADRVQAEVEREATIARLAAIRADVTDLPVGANATASVTQTENSTTLHFGIPAGYVLHATFEIDDNMNLIMTMPEE